MIEEQKGKWDGKMSADSMLKEGRVSAQFGTTLCKVVKQDFTPDWKANLATSYGISALFTVAATRYAAPSCPWQFAHTLASISAEKVCKRSESWILREGVSRC